MNNDAIPALIVLRVDTSGNARIDTGRLPVFYVQYSLRKVKLIYEEYRDHLYQKEGEIEFEISNE